MTGTATSRSVHWAQLGESTFVAGLWFLYGVHRVLGRLPFRMALYPVVFYYWATRAVARAASMQYLQRIEAAYGVIGCTPRWHHGVRHFLAFADSILYKMLAVSGRYRIEPDQVQGGELVDELIARGQGAVFITAHIGCVELCQTLATQRPGMRLNVLVHTAHAQRFSRVLRRLDARATVQFIEVADITPATAVLLSERVTRGEFLAIAGDRIPLGAGRIAQARFLGIDAPYPVGPYVLASLLKCPLLLMTCARRAGRYHVQVQCLAQRIDLPRSQRSERLTACAALYAQNIERVLRQAPYEWSNFFPFWDLPTPNTASHTSSVVPAQVGIQEESTAAPPGFPPARE